MPVQLPQWTEYLNCPVCFNKYNDDLHQPLSLGCGHTACKTCLSKLHQHKCPFDQGTFTKSIEDLPPNNAIIKLVNGKPQTPKNLAKLIMEENVNFYESCMFFMEDLASNLKPVSCSTQDTVAFVLGTTTGTAANATNTTSISSPLSRPMQRKLVTLINCQLIEDEGRSRAMRAARSLGERTVTELILHHQNPHHLSANLWAAVRARGCQFLGPAMQEEVLRLILLALEDGSALSRKVLVLFVVQRLEAQYPQASKTAIGHVVQLLYRASCFKVTKRDEESSLMQLKDEFRSYEALRREHDSQVVQIATEAGLRIAPEQWSSLLYGDTTHKSHMQSIIDKLQTPQSFSQSVSELVIALQRTGDPGNLSRLRPHLDLLANIDPSPDTPSPSWENLYAIMRGTHTVIQGLIEFTQSHSFKKYDTPTMHSAKYKTSMCRDFIQKSSCPRGAICTFAHSDEEMERYRAKSKRMAKAGLTNPTSQPPGSIGIGDCGDISHATISLPPANMAAMESLTVTASNGPSTVTAISSPVNMASTVCSSMQSAGAPYFIVDTSSKSNTSGQKYIHSAPHHVMKSGQMAYDDPVSRIYKIQQHQMRYNGPSNNIHVNRYYTPTSGPGAGSSKSSALLQDLYHHRKELLAQLHGTARPSIQKTSLISHSSLHPLSTPKAMTPIELSRSVSDTAGTMHVTSTLAHLVGVGKQRDPLSPVVRKKAAKTSNSSSSSYTAWSSGDDADLQMSDTDVQPMVSDDEMWKESSGFQSKVCTEEDDEYYAPLIDDDDDDFVPFDPVPRVSKYGPISRVARARIRNTDPVMATASLQGNSTTQMTAVTPISHPYPTVTRVPSIYSSYKNEQSQYHPYNHSGFKTPSSEPHTLWALTHSHDMSLADVDRHHVMNELKRIDRQIQIVADDDQLVHDLQAFNTSEVPIYQV